MSRRVFSFPWRQQCGTRGSGGRIGHFTVRDPWVRSMPRTEAISTRPADATWPGSHHSGSAGGAGTCSHVRRVLRPDVGVDWTTRQDYIQSDDACFRRRLARFGGRRLASGRKRVPSSARGRRPRMDGPVPSVRSIGRGGAQYEHARPLPVERSVQ